MLIRKCLLAMQILMLILMLLNLNTGYANIDADLCIRIMSLCCTTVKWTKITIWWKGKLFLVNFIYRNEVVLTGSGTVDLSLSLSLSRRAFFNLYAYTIACIRLHL